MPAQHIPYIPAGSVVISKDLSNLGDDVWAMEELRSWNTLSHVQVSAPVGAAGETLPADIQTALLRSPDLSAHARLFRSSWIVLEFCITSDEHATLRVHLLPDDTHRGTLDRSETSLRKDRLFVLKNLDFSKEAWDGKPSAGRIGSPTLYDPSKDKAEETSLLQLFNQIPSPQPDPDMVKNDYSRDAVYDLLQGSIPGLSSELYPYQTRSAALMLQKEAHPGQVTDPRLLHLRDQIGSAWYLDPVAGTVLREARLYDGISGGILAEEMGAGKTIICLALILVTKHLPSKPPSIYPVGGVPVRRKIASLADMAASCAARNAVPWRPYYEFCKNQLGLDFERCTQVLERNPGYYFIPPPVPQRKSRQSRLGSGSPPPKKVYLSGASLIAVPNNLVDQWRQEIRKHTSGLRVLVLQLSGNSIPPPEELVHLDIILLSQSRLEQMARQTTDAHLSQVHFKRCIVDEGHKLGNSRSGHKSNMHRVLDTLSFSNRWIVTGTPSHGLFGIEIKEQNGKMTGTEAHPHVNGAKPSETSTEMEKRDLERIGSITAKYLKARPWANTIRDTENAEDTLADWSVYMMLPKHMAKGRGRLDCLRSTLNSLIIRHQMAEVGSLLPPVQEKITMLEGSYQDRLSLNIFSMMIIFNSVQSQRTDMDYFFHAKQRKSLLQIVHNLKQTSFFGGSFFTAEEMAKSVETAEEFLRENKVAVSPEDESLLQQAIDFGHVAMCNELRTLSNRFHEMPVCVKGFPHSTGDAWSLGGKMDDGGIVCTSAGLLLALQKLMYDAAAKPELMNSLLNGGLIQKGADERTKVLREQASRKQDAPKRTEQTLAGNTRLGNDGRRKSRSHGADGDKKDLPSGVSFGALESATIMSTVSAKLSYLIDSIVKYQNEEKIMIFYENDNVAWYLSAMLDVVSQKWHLLAMRD